MVQITLASPEHPWHVAQLTPHWHVIEPAIQRACRLVAHYFPTGDEPMLISTGAYEPGHWSATGGCCPSKNHIHLNFEPGHRRFIEGLRDDLPVWVAHELIHAHQHGEFGYGVTIGEEIVSEGEAVFAEFRVARYLWGEPPLDYHLSPAAKAEHIEKLSKIWHLNADANRWYEREIPRYRLGFALIQDYCRAVPGGDQLTSLDLVKIPPQKILTTTLKLG